MIQPPFDLAPPQLASHTSSSPSWKRLRKARRHAAMRYYWYMVGAVVLGWILLRLVFALRRRLVRRAATSRTWTLLTVRPLGLPFFPAITASELFLVVGYTVATVALSVFGSYFAGVIDYSNPTGMVAVAQLPLIVGLVGRNSVLSTLTGVSYDHINYLHRTSGRVCFLGSLAHTYGWLFSRGLGKHAWTWRVYTAIPAMAGLTVLTFFSFRAIRNRYHQLFRDAHIVAALMFLIMTYFHTPEYRIWVWPALLLWSLDRAAGLARLLYVFVSSRGDTTATVELLDTDVLRVSVPVPFKWKAGTHGYLSIPSVSELPWEQHPFTFANIPTAAPVSPAVFVMRVHGGFTRQLRDAMVSTIAQFPANIEGPYGEPINVTHYDSLLCIAGGSGVTLCLSYFLNAIQADRGAPTSIRMAWNTRKLIHVRTIAPLLEAALESLSPNSDLRIRIDIHITRSHASDEPTDPNVGLDSVPELKAPDEQSPLLQHLRHLRGDSYSSYGSQCSSRASLASTEDDLGRLSEEERFRTGLGPVAAAHTRIHFGRSLVTDMIRSEASDGGRLGVIVCGPPQLTLDARNGVTTVIPEGGAEIDFHSGSFCF
ncbi:hypothetical protein CspeluHIS016_0600840 [Cutaneotrichosporon spelunceum]|uniref:ferric-chelate reductase (NADPH) n=1 Tax=Cutaneotrichosporon spelunceum TaxID=1672016 RepID=A0AAD3YE54_9TREE|nr:hypothetical protein CspeluHIS016_0600840 [Cutaneotrichosporon spelunceum]